MERLGINNPEWNHILDSLKPSDQATMGEAMAELNEIFHALHARMVSPSTGVAAACWSNAWVAFDYLADLAACTGLSARFPVRDPASAERCLRQLRPNPACGNLAKELNSLFQNAIRENHWHMLESREDSWGQFHGWVVLLFRFYGEGEIGGRHRLLEGVVNYDPWTGERSPEWPPDLDIDECPLGEGL